jgi:hypothetical protein
MQVAEDIFKAAILSLEAKLGERPEGMVHRIGCSFGAYKLWVRGDRIPGGEWLIKILNLCPDAESLAKFGLDITRLGEGKDSLTTISREADITPDVKPNPRKVYVDPAPLDLSASERKRPIPARPRVQR